MKNIDLFLLPVIVVLTYSLFSPASAQEFKILKSDEVEEITNAGVDLLLPVFKGFEYRDRGGMWDMMLLEDGYAQGRDTATNSTIEGVLLLLDHGGYLKKMAFTDVIQDDERDIRFWTSYCSFIDLDNDGHVDPIIVYASYRGDSRAEEEAARINIFILHKGRKAGIYAKECALDSCRSIRFDKNYTSLPHAIRQHLSKLMQVMREEKNVLLKNG